MVTPSNPAEQRIWDLYGDQIKAMVAESPPLTPSQIRDIRAIWLGIVTRKASSDQPSKPSARSI